MNNNKNVIGSIDGIRHQGVVIDAGNQLGSVSIRIDNKGECIHCPAAKLCEGNDSGVIEAWPENVGVQFTKGDRVVIIGSEQMHRRAIILAAVLPCLILVTSMVIVYILGFSQLISALFGLGTTVMFFFILWLMRNNIANKFRFIVKHDNMHE